MNFKSWALTEGWSLDLSNVPFEELQAQLAGGQSAAVNWLKERARFNYSGKTDLPQDFIKIIPYNKLTELPTVAFKRYLPSFEGVKVFYGYTFVTPKNYQDQYTSYQPRASQHSNIDGEINRVLQYARQGNMRPPFTRPKSKLSDYIDSMVATNVENLAKMHPRQFATGPAQGWTIEDMFEKIGTYAAQMYGNNNKLEFMTYLVYAYHTALTNKKKELNSKFSKRKDVENYLGVIKVAFSKVLKEPKTPNGMKVRDIFIKQAADNFYRLMGSRKYDLIVYPSSSKDFNKAFGDYLAKMYGISAIEGFSKLPAGQVTIDEPALQSHFPDSYEKKIRHLQSGGAGYSGLATANPDKQLQIKNFPQRLRRYIKMWQPTANLKNKRILVIDDNVDAGGTLERVYDIIKKQQPKAVDIYSPLYIGGGHGVTHG